MYISFDFNYIRLGLTGNGPGRNHGCMKKLALAPLLLVAAWVQFPALGAPEVRIAVDAGKTQVTILGGELDRGHQQALQRSLEKHVADSPLSKSGKVEVTLRGEDAEGFLTALREIPLNGEEDEDFESELEERLGEQLRFSKRSSKDPERVAIGQSIEIKAGEKVRGLVLIGGTAKIAGHVDGLVSIGSTLNLLPGAKITGEWVRIGSEATVDPKAVVRASEVGVQFPWKGWDFSRATRPKRGATCSSVGCWLSGLAAGIGTGVLCWVLGLVFLLLAPKLSDQAAQELSRSWLSAFGKGVLAMLSFVPTLVFLVCTILGIALIPAYLLAFAVLAGVGYGLGAIVLAKAFLARVRPKAKVSRGALLALGVLGLAILRAVPVLGWLAATVVGTAGFGIAFQMAVAAVWKGLRAKK